MKPKQLSISLPIIFLFVFHYTFASEFISGDKRTISTPVEDDLYIAAGEISVDAKVAGDLVCTGGEIAINDSVMYDLTAAGGKLWIDGYVGDDIRAAGGEMEITGGSGGDLIVFGGKINIRDNAVISGDLLIFGGEVKLGGTVIGHVKVYGGEVQMYGTAEGPVTIKGGRIDIDGTIRGFSSLAAEEIRIGPGAEFYNDVEYWQEGGEIDFGDAMVNGRAIFTDDLRFRDEGWFPDAILGIGIFTFIVFYIIAAVLILILLQWLFKSLFIKAGESLSNQTYLRSVGIGILYLIITPIVAVILMVTLIGFPVGLFVMVNYGFTVFLGHLIAALVFTNLMKLKYSPHWNDLTVIVMALVLGIVIKIVSFIPFLGWLISFITIAMAFGSIIINIKLRKKRYNEESPAS